MRLLIDIDSTIADTLPHWLDGLYQKYGVRAHIEDITRWDLSSCPPLTNLTKAQIFGILQDPGFLSSADPMFGAKEMIAQLQTDGHEIYLVTARDGSVSIGGTLDWLKEHLPFLPPNALIFCKDKHLIGADVIIDDNRETLVAYGDYWPKSKRIAISYPYNTPAPADIELVSYGNRSWAKIYEIIKGL